MTAYPLLRHDALDDAPSWSRDLHERAVLVFQLSLLNTAWLADTSTGNTLWRCRRVELSSLVRQIAVSESVPDRRSRQPGTMIVISIGLSRNRKGFLANHLEHDT